MNPEELPKVQLVFLYQYENSSGKTVYQWMTVEGEKRTYSGNKHTNIATAHPGMIFEFPEEGAQIYSNRAKYIGMWTNKDEILIWSARNRANYQEKVAKNKLKKIVDDDILLHHIARMKMAYHSLNATQRPQFIAWVIQKIAG